MPKHNVGFEGLIPYLPQNAYHLVVDYIVTYKIQFTISKDRNTILGDYRPPFNGKGHRISVNGSLNPFAFLITFIHELAHLQNHIENGRKVLPHGKEWQQLYSKLLEVFVEQQIFPSDIVTAIRKRN
jgi:SprT protein